MCSEGAVQMRVPSGSCWSCHALDTHRPTGPLCLSLDAEVRTGIAAVARALPIDRKGGLLAAAGANFLVDAHKSIDGQPSIGGLPIPGGRDTTPAPILAGSHRERIASEGSWPPGMLKHVSTQPRFGKLESYRLVVVSDT